MARILIVDDDPNNRALLRELCLRAKHEVAQAADGVEALALVAAKPPEAILLDVMMPRLDGYGVLEAIKSNPDTRHIAVLMVTAAAEPERRLEALERGADDFITKPFRPMTVLKRLEKAIGYGGAARKIADAAAAEAQAAPETDPEGFGDYLALKRSLDAFVRESGATLACLACVPRPGTGPHGSERLAWLRERAVVIRGELPETAEVFLLGGDEVLVLSRDCDGGCIDEQVAAIKEALGWRATELGLGGVQHDGGDPVTLLWRARRAASPWENDT